jgi:hypothetical protein
MTPSLPESPVRRRNEQIIGVLLAVLGIVVLVVAIIALQHPKGHRATAAPAANSSTAAAPKTTPATTPATTPKTSPSRTPSTPASTSASVASTTPPSSPAASTTATTVVKLPLIVLNSTSITGLAENARTRFESGGWTVTTTGNLVNNIISTCAYYDPNVEGAQAAATALQAQFSAIKRVVPKFAELPAGPIVVVLTADYA